MNEPLSKPEHADVVARESSKQAASLKGIEQEFPLLIVASALYLAAVLFRDQLIFGVFRLPQPRGVDYLIELGT